MARTARCPICDKPTIAAFAPFCSKRCADIDLNRWLGGAYAIATDEPSGDDTDNLASQDRKNGPADFA
ncbi:MAG: DNA gyrase inhibitor YacG [Pseudomonadota bacterium]